MGSVARRRRGRDRTNSKPSAHQVVNRRTVGASIRHRGCHLSEPHVEAYPHPHPPDRGVDHGEPLALGQRVALPERYLPRDVHVEQVRLSVSCDQPPFSVEDAAGVVEDVLLVRAAAAADADAALWDAAADEDDVVRRRGLGEHRNRRRRVVTFFSSSPLRAAGPVRDGRADRLGVRGEGFVRVRAVP
eukprot:31456-Pelagococcus_subviridis.AAC.4